MIKEYRKKPVVVQAVQWTGVVTSEIREFLGEQEIEWMLKESEYGIIKVPYIKTLEGYMRVSFGDYIIKGVKGELYPCKPDIFDETYEQVEQKTED